MSKKTTAPATEPKQSKRTTKPKLAAWLAKNDTEDTRRAIAFAVAQDWREVRDATEEFFLSLCGENTTPNLLTMPQDELAAFLWEDQCAEDEQNASKFLADICREIANCREITN